MSEQYDEDYFLRGKQTGKSLYENYRYLPTLTIPMVQRFIEHLGIQKRHTILDVGCARGYVVKAFRHLGHDAYGMDCSKWAIDNADPEAREFLRLRDRITHPFDWIIAKDTLEHVPQVEEFIEQMQSHARIGVFVVVPLSAVDGEKYVLADYEADVTHIHRLTLATWARMFLRPGWEVTASYRVRGIKDNHYITGWEPGDGFIVARRIPE